MADPPIDWTRGEHDGLVSIGTHSLNLYSYGPDHDPEVPVVIIIPDLGSSIKSWAGAVRCIVAEGFRTYLYDRSGYGGSDISSSPPTSTTIASELDLLLKSARIVPPYILVAHSWGGILCREFLALRKDDVAGVVFVDASQEKMLKVCNWQKFIFSNVLKSVDYHQVTGLDKKHKLTDEEWRAYRDEENSEKHQDQACRELKQYDASFIVLGSKKQLHRDPPFLNSCFVSVLIAQPHRDFEKLFKASAKGSGNGTFRERAECREELKTWETKNKELQEELKSLSRYGYHRVMKCGHHIQLLNPQAIADEVFMILVGI